MEDKSKIVSIDQLECWDKNPRFIQEKDFARLKRQIEKLKEYKPLVVYPENGHFVVLGGNMRLRAYRELGKKEVWVSIVHPETEADKLEIALSDNDRAGEYDDQKLAELVYPFKDDLVLEDYKVDLGQSIDLAMALDRFSLIQTDGIAHSTLAERFIIPPFSVFDTRQGYWQDRKRQWLALGIKGELGRGEENPNGLLGESQQAVSHYKEKTLGAIPSNQATKLSPDYKKNRLSPGGSPRPACDYSKKERGDGRGKPLARSNGQDIMKGENEKFCAFKSQSRLSALQNKRLTWVKGNRQNLDETSLKNLEAQPQSGTSIFDPVLCEIIYKWFCPEGGKILDPFAGGSVRGVVACYLKFGYTGIELRKEQVEANEIQVLDILNNGNRPQYIVGDSAQVDVKDKFDLLFSCPPYYDLEVYSDSDGELSAYKTYQDFLPAYNQIIKKSCDALNDNRFACFVVGDIRDKKGFYRGFVKDTIIGFEKAGMTLYNDAILINAIGSLPIRVGRSFGGYRKLGKTHQNVLIFYKGDPKKISEFMPDKVDSADLGLSQDVIDSSTSELVDIRISGKMLKQKFHPCDMPYINTVCKGRCCQGSGKIMVTVHPSEEERIKSFGAKIEDGFIVADQRGLCPFKLDNGLCKIHGEQKPLGCQASPFTLNNKDLLIVRNRYRMLKCFNCKDSIPAYKAHRWSLERIFGEMWAAEISKNVESGIDNFTVKMPIQTYRILKDNDMAKRNLHF